MKYTLEIIQDTEAEPPIDDVAKILCWHRNYQIGNKHNYKHPEDFAHAMESKFCGNYVDWPHEITILPIYAYEHSGITIRTSSFSCSWDSGQIGWVYLENHVAEKEGITDYKAYLESIVATYDQYLTGDIWGYVIKEHSKPCDHCGCTPEPEVVDSCFGFYGHETAEAEGNAALASFQKSQNTQLTGVTTNA